MTDKSNTQAADDEVRRVDLPPRVVDTLMAPFSLHYDDSTLQDRLHQFAQATMAETLARVSREDVLRWYPDLAAQPTPEPVAQADGGPLAWQSTREGLLAYVLQDDLHNRLTPRVIDIAHTAFMSGASGKNKDDGGPCDWFNDTLPIVREAIERVRKDLSEAAAAPSPVALQGRDERDQIEAIARAHGTGGWQTLEDMVRFGLAVLQAARASLPAGGVVEPTDEEIADAIECEFSVRHEWPAGDAEIVRAFLKHWKRATPQPSEIPASWTPTAANINALPEPVREYIHGLVANCDPAGMVADNTIKADQVRELSASNRQLRDALAETQAPIPMVLHCPKCGMQHIDAREEDDRDEAVRSADAWDNPPHRSHLCHGCDTIWRPADVPTIGVKATATKGKADNWVPSETQGRSTRDAWKDNET